MPAKEIEVLYDIPPARVFESKYVRRHRPVILKGLASKLLPQANALLSSSSSSSMDSLRDILDDAGRYVDR